MQRPQDITFKFVVKDEELKQLYIDNLKNYKFGDRGVDLIVPMDYIIPCGSGSNKVPHNIQVAAYYTFEDGTQHEVGYDLRLRSGTGVNTRLRLSNQCGTIDLYRGDITALLDHTVFTNDYPREVHSIDLNTGKQCINIARGTRLVQLVNPNGFGCVVEFVDELPSTERDDKGFGSSGGI
jgi:dUTPase